MSVTQLDKGDAFLALHRGPRAFILANAWDAGSARILAGLGFSAIGTSSWASANVYGRHDHAITREQSLATPVPSPAPRIFPSRRISKAGSALAERGGRNLPSGRSRRPRRRDDRGCDARTQQGQPAVRHRRSDRARCRSGGSDAQAWISVLVDRARRGLPSRQYQSRRRDPAPAGLREGGRRRADGARLAGPQLGEGGVRRDRQALQLHGRVPGKSFSVPELEAVGVRRISLANSLYRAAMGGLVAAAREAKDKGTLHYVDTSLPMPELVGYMQA